MQKNINDILFKLSNSKFRCRFHLKDRDLLYVKDKGLDVIEEHAYNFITKRLASMSILNDEKQTPYKGHPVFIAQHATGTCCRECLYKWHHIDKNKELDDEEVKYIVSVIMAYIIRELESRE